MATATGLTKTRMLSIEAGSITAARLSAGELILTTHGGTDINVGSVQGSQGIPGPAWTPTPIRAKMTKSTLGHDAAGGTYTANTWTKLAGFTTTDYATNFAGVSLTDAQFVPPSNGNYSIKLQARWGNYGTAYSRACAIVKGTNAPATDGSNVLAIVAVEAAGWNIAHVDAFDVPLATTDTISFWIRAGVTSTFNAANTLLPGWSFVSIHKTIS